MKKVIFYLCLSMSLVSCRQDEVMPSNSSVEAVRAALIGSAGWSISEFIEDGNNKTASFNEYLFTFDPEGVVVASYAGGSVNGTFSVFRDDGRTELQMTFPNNGILSELSDEWYFVFQDNNRLRFEDNGDILQFQK